jgi:dTDP-glucose pyrophosphorylase
VIDKIKNRIIDQKENLLVALKLMDFIDKKLLLVFEGSKFINILSVGDIQRAILKNNSLDTPVKSILRENTRIASEEDSYSAIKKLMNQNRIECMPVVNKKKELIKVYFWEDVFGEDEKRNQCKLNLPVVIMAGGKGTRLKPFTNVIPKPIIPIGDKTIIEEIMDRFVDVGCDEFYISVNYKAETIKQYFLQLKNNKYKTSYLQEKKPLGTAGSLFLVKDMIKTTFFVSNCDIIIDEDYSEILKYHQKNKNELTIVAALKHYPIPYGTIKTKSGGILDKLTEKPEITFQINSGMYILEPHLLKEIPENGFLHITHLIENILIRGGKVGVFPVSEGSWKDLGTLSNYLVELNH